MQLISLTLDNIRSYTNTKLEFPSGIVMLSGDIGSGKSTILLAIEFALFGLLRGELSGSALLRNGTNSGSVELAFSINNHTYSIKRTLRRTKTSVEQEAGHILIDGVKKEATAIELKSTILELLGYPEELLNKSKNFIFRYTVYTPQEDMKRILLDSREERVGLLRKVFDIDKYSRITQNAGTYAKALRERKRALDLVTADLAQKRKQADDARKESALAQEQLKAVLPSLDVVRAQLAQTRAQITTVEGKRQQSEIVSRELTIVKTKLVSVRMQEKTTAIELGALAQQILSVQREIAPVIDTQAIMRQISDISSSLTLAEKKARDSVIIVAEQSTLKKQSMELSQKINTLAQCPTCLQEVSSGHKERILRSAQEKIATIDAAVMHHQHTALSGDEELARLKVNLEILRKQERDAAVSSVRIAHANDMVRRKELLEKNAQNLVNDAQALEQKGASLELTAREFGDISNAYQKLKVEVDSQTQQERLLSIQQSTLVQKEQYAARTLAQLSTEIERKESARQQLERTQHVHTWLTDYFTPLMDLIERQVMAKIHHEFDALFQQWFSTLIEDLMSARLDETFTPIVSQNGYEIDVEHLSGGERTACALAYRLALNKTINSLISSTQTRDLLILDEPTDGFSSEQLDKMRDVLAQLDLGQIIIVSHEQKIEGFADQVIRIRKENHVSLTG